MDVATFKATIAKFGEANLITIYYNNASKTYFPNLNFTLAANFNEVDETIIVKEIDVVRNEYMSMKFVADVQGFIFATTKTKRDQLDSRYLTS